MKKIITFALILLLLLALSAPLVGFAESERDGWRHTGDHRIGDGLYVSIYAMTRDELGDEFENVFRFPCEEEYWCRCWVCRDDDCWSEGLKLLVPNQTLRNFRWINPPAKWTFSMFESETWLCDGLPRSLYETNYISPDNPFVFEWRGGGTMYRRGFSFTDEDGETQYFFIVDNFAMEYTFSIWRANARPHIDVSKISVLANQTDFSMPRFLIRTFGADGIGGSGLPFHYTYEVITSLPKIYDPQTLYIHATDTGVGIFDVQIKRLTADGALLWYFDRMYSIISLNEKYDIPIPNIEGEFVIQITIVYSDFEEGYQLDHFFGEWRNNIYSEFIYAFRVIITETIYESECPDDNGDYNNGVEYPEQPSNGSDEHCALEYPEYPHDENENGNEEPPYVHGGEEVSYYNSSNLPLIIGLSAAVAVALGSAIIFIFMKKQK